MFKNSTYVYDRVKRSDGKRYKSTLGGNPIPMTGVDYVCLAVDLVIDSFVNKIITQIGKILKIEDLHKSCTGLYNYTIQHNYEHNRSWRQSASVVGAFKDTHRKVK